MRGDRLLSLAGLLLACCLGAGLLAVPATARDTVPIDGAVLAWAINDESSNRAFAPRTVNLLSAGRVPDPGTGGWTISRAQWAQRVGEVSIQKWDGAAWRAATWRGLSTDSEGAPLGSPTAGTFSHHRFVMGAGVGEVDVAAGTARVAWDGDLTVLYYSGMSMFYVSDPVLEVADGRGVLTATVQGFASSVEDPGSWEPLPAREVTLADLPEVDLGDGSGFTATPAYLGVRVQGVAQVAGDAWSGSFPQDFVDYMAELGTAPFWFSSGSATDPFKVALPVSVAFAPEVDLPEPSPSAEPSGEPIDNPIILPPPTVTVTVTPSPSPASASPAPSAASPASPAPSAVPPPASSGVSTLPVATRLTAQPPQTSAAPAGTESETTRLWWLGGGLLLAAASVLLLPVRKAPR